MVLEISDFFIVPEILRNQNEPYAFGAVSFAKKSCYCSSFVPFPYCSTTLQVTQVVNEEILQSQFYFDPGANDFYKRIITLTTIGFYFTKMITANVA